MKLRLLWPPALMAPSMVVVIAVRPRIRTVSAVCNCGLAGLHGGGGGGIGEIVAGDADEGAAGGANGIGKLQDLAVLRQIALGKDDHLLVAAGKGGAHAFDRAVDFIGCTRL
jgi:hypothetical protein